MKLTTLLRREVRAIAKSLDLDLVYLFGSAARGDMRPGSDVDVAVESATRLSDRDLVALRTRLSAAFGRDVDLVDLSFATPLLARQILLEGIPLFGAERTRESFYRMTAKRYIDALPLFKATEQYVKDRLAV